MLLHLLIHPASSMNFFSIFYLLNKVHPAVCRMRFVSIYYLLNKVHPAVFAAMLSTLPIHATSCMKFFSIQYVLKFIMPFCLFYQFILPAAWSLKHLFIFNQTLFQSCCHAANFTSSSCPTAMLLTLRSSFCHAVMRLTLPINAAVRPWC